MKVFVSISCILCVLAAAVQAAPAKRLTINGLHPGMTRAQIEAKIGKPIEVSNTEGYANGVQVFYTLDDIAVDVFGTQLEIDGKAVMTMEMGRTKAFQRLADLQPKTVQHSGLYYTAPDGTRLQIRTEDEEIVMLVLSKKPTAKGSRRRLRYRIGE